MYFFLVRGVDGDGAYQEAMRIRGLFLERRDKLVAFSMATIPRAKARGYQSGKHGTKHQIINQQGVRVPFYEQGRAQADRGGVRGLLTSTEEHEDERRPCVAHVHVSAWLLHVRVRLSHSN